MAADLVKGGIAAFKASERLEELCQQATDFCEGMFTDENKKLLKEYTALKKKQDAIKDAEESNKMTDDVEKALVSFLLSVAANPAVSKKFTADVKAGVAEWNRTNNDLPMEIFEKRMMKEAKTEEERAEIRKVLDEIAAEDAKK